MSTLGTNPDQARSQAFRRASGINDCFRQCVAIFDTKIFSAEGARSPLFQAATVQLLILLNDLLRKANSEGKRIAITDHVDRIEEVADVTDLITKCRNAACHIGSALQEVDTSKFRFTVIIGKGVGMSVNGRDFGNDFDDDIAIFYGEHRLYVKRHLVAAIEALRSAFADEIADDWVLRLNPK